LLGGESVEGGKVLVGAVDTAGNLLREGDGRSAEERERDGF
jgi:hypothetical protein